MDRQRPAATESRPTDAPDRRQSSRTQDRPSRRPSNTQGLIASSELGEELVELLRCDADEGLSACGITIIERDGGGNCDLDASFDRANRIATVAASASTGRRRFSLLHELGHDRINSGDSGVADWLDEFDAHADAIEERVCDAFAAEIIFSSVEADLPRKFTALDVIRLHETTGASREACCVYAAQCMFGPGIVLLARGDTVLFSSPHSLNFRVGRGVAQHPDSVIAQAAARPDGFATARLERLTLRTGRSHTELEGDARRTGDGYVFAVLREAPPDVDHRGQPRRKSWFCRSCGDDITDADWCDTCQRRICPDCGCQCPEKPPPPPVRRCPDCGMEAAASITECELCGHPIT